jgi:glycosyltransferase involved in cell wall biosynthesis
VIMYHGSLVERNGLEVAIDALERVRKTVPHAVLHIFGTSTQFLEHIMKKVRDRNLEGSVQYFGPKRLEELVAEIDKCDIGVIPNHRNAFTEINTPTRIFEYLALGKPVIAPSTPGIQDYFNEESLLFFEPGNADHLAKQIEFASSHPDEILEIARRGQQVYGEHTWDQERETLLSRASGILPGGGSKEDSSGSRPLEARA